jgi:hypothetical protein
VTAMLEIPGEVDGGHSPAAELALEDVAVAQGVSNFGSRPLKHFKPVGWEDSSNLCP